MSSKKTIWSTITGALASIVPLLFSVCKGGACVGVCVSPVASLFGISTATLATSPWVSALEPLLIALSAVSFTSSYYSLYVLPKFKTSSCDTGNACGCAPDPDESKRVKRTKFIFWFGLILSIVFLTYFEIQKYQASSAAAECSTTECSTSECAPGECGDDAAVSENPECGETCDLTTCH